MSQSAVIPRVTDTRGGAQRAITACWALSAILLIGGAVIAGLMATTTDGSVGGLVAGLALAAVGQLIMLVAIIATGVRLGVESANRA